MGINPRLTYSIISISKIVFGGLLDIITGHALHEKGLQRQNRRRSTGQQLGTKSASRPADKPQVNRLSTADFVPAFGLHRISLVRASEEMLRTIVFDAPEETSDGCVLRGETRRRSILPSPPCPAAPLCAARPDLLVVCPGFGLDRS